MKYLSVDVLTTSGMDCSNHGVTARMPNNLVVECEEGYLSEEDIVKRGSVVLYPRVIMGSMHLRPATNGRHSMFGGNFVWSSDSRFGKMFGRQPVHVHDRFE